VVVEVLQISLAVVVEVPAGIVRQQIKVFLVPQNTQ
jgi:hypothetical protein